MSCIDSVTKDSFDELVLDFPGRVLVDMYSDSCGPCKRMLPLLESFAADHEGEVRVVKLNITDEIELALDMGVMAVPTFLVYQFGDKLRQHTGAMTADELAAFTLAD